MEICFYNYNEPPGAKWKEIKKVAKHSDLNIDFVISDDLYREHQVNLNIDKPIKSKYTKSRIINWLIFIIKSIGFFLNSNYDKYVILTQPPLFYLIAAIILRIRGKKYYLYTMDLYPENLDFNTFSKLLKYILYPFAKLAYNGSSKIMVIGRDMQKVLSTRYNIEGRKFFFQRNWASFNSSNVINYYKYSSLIYGLYAGNMGYPHDFSLIKDMLIQLKNSSLIDKFYFVGKGLKKDSLTSFCEENDLLDLVEFKGFLDDSEFNNIVINASFHTICLSKKKTGIMVPSKFYTSVESLKPVLYFGDKDSEIALDIDEYGLGEIIDEGNVNFKEKIRNLLEKDYKNNLINYSQKVNNANIAAHNIINFLKN